MNVVYKISAKNPEVHAIVNVLDFPTYGSAEAAIQELPDGIYAIERNVVAPKELYLVGDKIIVS